MIANVTADVVLTFTVHVAFVIFIPCACFIKSHAVLHSWKPRGRPTKKLLRYEVPFPGVEALSKRKCGGGGGAFYEILIKGPIRDDSPKGPKCPNTEYLLLMHSEPYFCFGAL